MVGIHAARYTPVYVAIVAHVEWYLMTSSVKNVEKRRIFILKRKQTPFADASHFKENILPYT